MFFRFIKTVLRALDFTENTVYRETIQDALTKAQEAIG